MRVLFRTPSTKRLALSDDCKSFFLKYGPTARKGCFFIFEFKLIFIYHVKDLLTNFVNDYFCDLDFASGDLKKSLNTKYYYNNEQVSNLYNAVAGCSKCFCPEVSKR